MTRIKKVTYSALAIGIIAVALAFTAGFFANSKPHSDVVEIARKDTAKAISDAEHAADAADIAAASARKAADSTKETAASAEKSASDTAESAKAAEQFVNKVK